MPSARSQRNPACGNSRGASGGFGSRVIRRHGLSALALSALLIPSLFRHSEHFYEIPSRSGSFGDPLLLLLSMADALPSMVVPTTTQAAERANARRGRATSKFPIPRASIRSRACHTRV